MTVPYCVNGICPVPTSIDYTGASDASPAIQAWLDSIPDGHTLKFAGGTYRMDKGLLIRGRNRLTFDGGGATFRATGTGQQIESLFYLGGLPVLPSSDIVIRDFILEGSSPTPGVYRKGEPEYQSGVTVLGGARVEIANVTVRKVYGDGLTVNAGAADVRFHDSHVETAGRNGVSVIVGTRTIIEDSAFDVSGYTAFDIEPWTAGTSTINTTIRRTTAGTWTNSWLSAYGNAGTTIDGITFTNNTANGPIGSGLTAGTFHLVINRVTPRRRNVVITDNIAKTPYSYKWEPVYRLEHIDGLTFLRNVIPYAGGGVGVINDSTSVVKDVP